jgi:hypothetical protein
MTRTAPLALIALLTLAPLAAAQELMKPTPQHEALAHDVGTWDAEVSMWMSPEGEPVKSKAVETNKMLGKMWLLSEYEGEVAGEKFSGRGAFGYDPLKKKYVGGWIDTMSPFMMQMAGEFDEETMTLTMHGEGTDCMTGKPCKSKMVTVYEGEDKKTFTMYMQDEDGKLTKTMEAKMTRRK